MFRLYAQYDVVAVRTARRYKQFQKDRVEFQTEAAAEKQMKLWYPTAKSACFRVAKIED